MIENNCCDKCGSMLFPKSLFGESFEQCGNCKAMRGFIRNPMFANTLFNWALIPRTMWRQRQAIREYKAILGDER